MSKRDRLDDAMLFDFEDLWGSDHVKVMTGDQLAVYVRLLSCQWREGDLPADPRLLALRASHGERHVTARDFVGDGTIETPEAGSLWEVLAPCYVIDVGLGVVYNERVRADRKAWMKKKAGWSKGGKAKGKKNQVVSTLEAPSNQVATKLEAPSEAPSPSLSSSPSLPPPGKERETKTSPASPPGDGGRPREPSKAERDFESWVPFHPNPVKRAKAKAAWCRLKASDRDAHQVRRFLAVAVVSRQWTEDDGRYIPGLEPFVNGKIWQDPLSAYPPAGSNGNPHAAGPGDHEPPGEVEGYLLRKSHLEGLRGLTESERDTDETDDDLDRFEASLRTELSEINASPDLKAQLREALADEG